MNLVWFKLHFPSVFSSVTAQSLFYVGATLLQTIARVINGLLLHINAVITVIIVIIVKHL